MKTQIEEWLVLEPKAIIDGLNKMAETSLVDALDQAHVLSAHFNHQDNRIQKIADFCAQHIDEAVRLDPNDSRVISALGLVIDHATPDQGYRNNAAIALKHSFTRSFAEDPAKARGQLHALRAGISAGDRVQEIATDLLLSSINPLEKTAPAELFNIVKTSHMLEESQKWLFLGKIIECAKQAPYETMDVLRVFIENEYASQSQVIKEAKKIYNKMQDNPFYLLEVLEREYGSGQPARGISPTHAGSPMLH